MPSTRRVPDNVVPLCPECRVDLTLVCSWPSRGNWGYDEIRTYECPTHGPVFVTPEVSVGVGPSEVPDQGPDHGDRDSLIPARRKPTPVLNADAIAVPEPEPEPDSN